jgi:NADPH:quinone reductase-like Zn-dependent oxidoreductase
VKAAVLEALGAVPRFADFADPVAADGEFLVDVTAAAIKPLDRAIIAGRHYSSPKPEALPIVPGQDGVGRLPDGSRGYFFANRRPFGAMAGRVPTCWAAPIPDALDDATAAAIVNPALAAWLPLGWRGQLLPGETVLILGATGAAGTLAVKAARLMGAGRVIAAGRNQAILATLGADATVDLRLEGEALVAAFRALGPLDVIVDYVWGAPVEALIAALTSAHTDVAAGSERGIRLVAVGEMAGAKVAMPSGVFRSSFLTILGSGTGNFPPPARMKAIIAEIYDHAVSGALAIATEILPLAEVEAAWPRAGKGDRIVLVP